MWGEIQAQINMGLTEEILEELFEIPATQLRLRDEEARVGRQVQALVKQESALATATAKIGASK